MQKFPDIMICIRIVKIKWQNSLMNNAKFVILFSFTQSTSSLASLGNTVCEEALLLSITSVFSSVKTCKNLKSLNKQQNTSQGTMGGLSNERLAMITGGNYFNKINVSELMTCVKICVSNNTHLRKTTTTTHKKFMQACINFLANIKLNPVI